MTILLSDDVKLFRLIRESLPAIESPFDLDQFEKDWIHDQVQFSHPDHHLKLLNIGTIQMSTGEHSTLQSTLQNTTRSQVKAYLRCWLIDHGLYKTTYGYIQTGRHCQVDTDR